MRRRMDARDDTKAYFRDARALKPPRDSTGLRGERLRRCPYMGQRKFAANISGGGRPASLRASSSVWLGHAFASREVFRRIGRKQRCPAAFSRFAGGLLLSLMRCTYVQPQSSVRIIECSALLGGGL